MIRESASRCVFASRRLVNEIARWVLGVHSPDGTIRVTNTASPSDGGSLGLDVDLTALKSYSAEWAERRGLSDPQREGVVGVIREVIDGISLVWRGGGLTVNTDWLNSWLRDILAAYGTNGAELKTAGYSGNVTVAYAGYTDGDTLDTYLKTKTLTIKDGLITDVADGDDVKIT